MGLQILFNLFKILLSILDKCIPKNERLMLFPVKNKNDYRDNLRFFHMAAVEYPEFECVLLSYEKSKWDKENVVYFHTLKGLFCWLSARMIVIHHGSKDIPYSTSIDFNRRKLINLWHSISLKTLGFAINNPNKNIIELKKEFNSYWKMFCSSKLDQFGIRASFGLPKKRIEITGLPRNDMLIKEDNELPTDLKVESEWLNKKLKDKKMILYMPTFREHRDSSSIFTNDECLQLKKLLEAHNAIFCVKKHPNDLALTFEGVDVFDIADSPIIEVGTLLRRADILITDYSSVWVDYLVMNKPIVSYCYDMDQYLEERGMLYDYNSVFPGKVNLSFNAFFNEIENVINGNITEKQAKIKSLFHRYCDGGNSNRICNRIIKSM